MASTVQTVKIDVNAHDASTQSIVRPRELSGNKMNSVEMPSKIEPQVFQAASNAFMDGAPYGDWRDSFIERGYAILKGAIAKDRAQYYESQIHDWIRSFSYTKNLDLNDRSTWREKNLPAHLPINVYGLYCCSHEKFMWDIRQEPGIIDAFSKIWGTDELLVSFDGFSFILPERPDLPPPKSWAHVDQSPFKRGLQCVQGIANLGDASDPKDASLVVYSNSHKYFDEFFDTQAEKNGWTSVDYYSLTESERDWFLSKSDVEEIKLSVNPGDLLVWDSRTIHYGGGADPGSEHIRSAVYVSYSPAKFATTQFLELKKKVFESWSGTTHWAHDNIVLRGKDIPLLPNYEPDPENRSEPLEKPELSDKLLKLAGVRRYS
ncbi:hypothetical protein LJB42_000737 [Komagataella kurtzmanii]|nr:hypothetical protein LJB42_000737 [Komagataella kurtzmanii]